MYHSTYPTATLQMTGYFAVAGMVFNFVLNLTMCNNATVSNVFTPIIIIKGTSNPQIDPRVSPNCVFDRGSENLLLSYK